MDSPGPSLNRWLELTAPPEDLAELAGWLAELVDYRSGRPRPAPVRQAPVTAKLAAYAAKAREGAMRVAAREAAARTASWAPPTQPVAPPAQPPAASEWVTTTAAAALTGKSPEWWRRLAKSGRVDARRDDRGAWQISRAALAARTKGREADGTGRGTAQGTG